MSLPVAQQQSFSLPQAEPEIPPDSLSARLQRVLDFGYSQRGKRYAGPVIGEPDSYRWGNPGFDCSSLVSACYRQIGVSLIAYTDAAYDQTKPVSHPLPGDIIFYFYDDEQAARIPHMGLIVRSDGRRTLEARYPDGVFEFSRLQGVGYEIRRARALS